MLHRGSQVSSKAKMLNDKKAIFSTTNQLLYKLDDIIKLMTSPAINSLRCVIMPTQSNLVNLITT